MKFGCYSDDVCGLVFCMWGMCSDEWNLFNCVCLEGWVGCICILIVNMICVYFLCVNGMCFNLIDVGKVIN